MALTNKSSDFEGILLIDKPSGCTSHDVVDRVRRKLRMKRIGHAGTLDPLATGLLIILVGKATSASQHLMSLDKEYEATAKLGVTTDSYDADGEVTSESEIPEDLTEEKLTEILNEFRGDQYQLPPMFSAKKIKGVPLYKLARKGKEVEREPRFIHVSKIELNAFESPTFSFTLRSSKGTYVRTIAHDIGQKLGCGAHLIQLRRTATDKFNIADAIPLEEFEKLSLVDINSRLFPAYKAVPQLIG